MTQRQIAYAAFLEANPDIAKRLAEKRAMAKQLKAEVAQRREARQLRKAAEQEVVAKTADLTAALNLFREVQRTQAKDRGDLAPIFWIRRDEVEPDAFHVILRNTAYALQASLSEQLKIVEDVIDQLEG